jgi:hypothetical protein
VIATAYRSPRISVGIEQEPSALQITLK